MIAATPRLCKFGAMTRNESISIALGALAHIAAEDDLLRVFCGATGLQPTDLAGRMEDADLLLAVLDFLLQDDAWVLSHAEATGVPPERVVAAQACLSGGAIPHWT